MLSGDHRDADLRDVHDIRTLKSIYCELADRCCTASGGRTAADEIVKLFVEDGTLEVPAEYGGAQVGRAAIHSFWMQQSVAFSFADHLVFNERIQVLGNTARGHWKNVIPVTLLVAGSPTGLWILGNYDDEYVKVQDRWWIKSVKVGIRRVFRRDDSAPI